MFRKQQIQLLLPKLKAEYGEEISTDLNYKTDWQLLFTVMLSAQNTDKNVNKVTKKLFVDYPTLQSFADVSIGDLEKAVYSTGYYKSKAKHIKASAEMLVRDFNGKIPDNIEDLIKLPGVGRKTANVVLGILGTNQDGVVVDTHVVRIAYRLGLTSTRTNREKAEKELNVIIPKKKWEHFSLYLINHGRRYCKARKPNCAECPLKEICPKIGV